MPSLSGLVFPQAMKLLDPDPQKEAIGESVPECRFIEAEGKQYQPQPVEGIEGVLLDPGEQILDFQGVGLLGRLLDGLTAFFDVLADAMHRIASVKRECCNRQKKKQFSHVRLHFAVAELLPMTGGICRWDVSPCEAIIEGCPDSIVRMAEARGSRTHPGPHGGPSRF
jgi:hypothetical protein